MARPTAETTLPTAETTLPTPDAMLPITSTAAETTLPAAERTLAMPETTACGQNELDPDSEPPPPVSHLNISAPIPLTTDTIFPAQSSIASTWAK